MDETTDAALSLPMLRTFADVAREGSFAAVALTRGVDPSSISRQVAVLESALGFRLFERSTRRLAITEAGQTYLLCTTGALEALAEAREIALDVLSEPKGSLRVSASVAFGERWIMPRIAGFRQTHPELAVDLLLTDRNVDLVAEGIDVVVRLAPKLEGTITATKLMDTRYRVVSSPEYIENHGTPSQPTDLTTHDCLLLALPGYRSSWRFRKNRKRLEVAVKGMLTVSSPLALLRGAIDGLGPALLASWTIQEELSDGRLIDLFPDWEASASDFYTVAWLAYPSRDYLPRKTRLFIEHMKECVDSQNKHT